MWSPCVVASRVWFAREYANLSAWLARAVFAVLWSFPLLVLILVITNDIHRLFRFGFRLDGHVEPILGPVGRAFTTYGFLLSLVSSAAFGLALRDHHRYTASLRRYASPGTSRHVSPSALHFRQKHGRDGGPGHARRRVRRLDTPLALFHLRMFDLMPIARGRNGADA